MSSFDAVQNGATPELLGVDDAATSAGDGSAEVVTLLFPPGPRAAPDEALERALRLLRPGCTGFAVTENLNAWRSMVMHLLAHPRVAVLDHLLVPLSAAELRAMVIEPYAPAAVEAAWRRLPPLGWGLPLLFTAAE